MFQNERDTRIAEAVRKYPVIYDRNDKNYKSPTELQSAWERVVEEANVDSVDVAKRLFVNLRKRFQRRRRHLLRRSTGSGVSITEAESKDCLSDLSFISWLEPHIIPKKNKLWYTNNFTGGDFSNKYEQMSGEESGDDAASSNGGEEDSNEEKAVTDFVHSSGDIIHIVTPSELPSPKRKTDPHVDNFLAKKSKKSDNAQVRYINSVKNTDYTKNDIHESKNLNFAMYIASEIDQLPEKLQRLARHEISNIIYNIQCQNDSCDDYKGTG